MVVRDRMSAPVFSVKVDDDYMTAWRIMDEHHVHHLPVVDSEGVLVGILAERDFRKAAATFMQNPIEVTAVMHRDVITVTPEVPLAEAAELMLKHTIGGLPVVDDANRLLGMLTETDILRAFVELERKA